MSYVSGHYRKGCYRNGKWVSGSYVSSHYRSGISSGSGFYSVNSTYRDTTEKNKPSNVKDREKLLILQNMEIISEMTKGIDVYSYARTLRFFDAYYPYDIEDVHYADMMLAMSLCMSIDELLALRISLMHKVISGIKQDVLEKIPDEIKKELTKCDLNGVALNDNSFSQMKILLNKDIDTCYNENIVRLLRNQEKITDAFCGECFLNLTICSNSIEYKDQIIQVAREKSNIDVSELLENIAKRYNDLRTHWNRYKEFKEGMNGYVPARQLVVDDFEYLRQFNWRLLPWEKGLYSELMSNSEDYLNEKRRYWKEIREKEGRSQRLDIKKQEKKSSYNTVIAIIVSLVVVGIIIGLFIYLSNSVGGEDDGTVANWFMALVCLLALMKGGKR